MAQYQGSLFVKQCGFHPRGLSWHSGNS
ncbi:mCG50220, partial [Mus musculus]